MDFAHKCLEYSFILIQIISTRYNRAEKDKIFKFHVVYNFR